MAYISKEEAVESFQSYVNSENMSLAIEYGREIERVKKDANLFVAAFIAGWDAVESMDENERAVPEALACAINSFVKGAEARANSIIDPEWPSEIV